MRGRVIIVGAGIGGLAAAIALDRVGWQVTVLERSEQLGDAGAGLSLAPNAMRCLDRLGLGDDARAASAPTHATANLRTPSGRYLLRSADDANPPLRGFRRTDLHRVLLDGLGSIPLRTGVEVTGTLRGPGGVTVQHHGGEESADLVVAADGIWSAIRQLVFPDAPAPTFLRYTAWLGVVRLPGDVRDGLGGSMTIGRRRYFLIHPLGGDRYYWALGANADQPRIRSADERAVVLDQIRDWHDPIPRLVAATRAIRHIDIHSLPPLPGYVAERVALLGDAAHAMSPDRGQGAAQSLEDALVLADCLARKESLVEALAEYDLLRRPRSQQISREAARVGSTMLGLGPVGYRLFTGALGLIPSRLWQRLTAPDSNQVWRWEPPELAVSR